MGDTTVELTLEDAELWMKELGFSPDRFLEKAGVESNWRLIKNRWKNNAAPKAREQIRTALITHEKERKQPTEIGSRILGLHEWNEAGVIIAMNTEVFQRELRRLREVAENVKIKIESERKAAVAEERLAELSTSLGVPEEAFESPTPKPARTRK